MRSFIFISSFLPFHSTRFSWGPLSDTLLVWIWGRLSEQYAKNAPTHHPSEKKWPEMGGGKGGVNDFSVEQCLSDSRICSVQSAEMRPGFVQKTVGFSNSLPLKIYLTCWL